MTSRDILDLVEVDWETFRSQYLGQLMLLRRIEDRLEPLPVDTYTAAFEALLVAVGLRSSSIRVVKEGAAFDGCLGERADGDHPAADPYVEPRRLAGALADGFTVVLRSLHRYFEPAQALAAQLRPHFATGVHVNGYITPAASRGLKLHYDAQEVFVVQIRGRKHWRVCEAPLRWPTASTEWHRLSQSRRTNFIKSASVIDDFVLTPGDVLYVPRGFLHAAETEDELSIHLTISVHPVTRRDLLVRLTSVLEEKEWLREAVDLHRLLQDEHAAEMELESIVKMISAAVPDINAKAVAWDARALVFGERDTWPLDTIAQYDAIRDPQLPNAYKKPAALQWLIQDNKENILLRTTLGDFQLNTASKGLVEVVMNAQRVCVTDLAKSYPVRSVLALVEALTRAGVLIPVTG